MDRRRRLRREVSRRSLVQLQKLWPEVPDALLARVIPSKHQGCWRDHPEDLLDDGIASYLVGLCEHIKPSPNKLRLLSPQSYPVPPQDTASTHPCSSSPPARKRSWCAERGPPWPQLLNFSDSPDSCNLSVTGILRSTVGLPP